MLTAVAWTLQDEWKDELIVSVNYGFPKTGNSARKAFVNSMDGLGIWRVVNGIDLVPRTPPGFFRHVGHTLQFDKREARAFWLHEGDTELGYRGVPYGWNTMPYALVPFAAVDHLIGKYTKYLDKKSAEDGASFYGSSFEKLDDDDHGGDSDGDDEVPPIPRPDQLDDDGDDDVWSPELSVEQQVGIINLFADEYFELVDQDHRLGSRGRDDLDLGPVPRSDAAIFAVE